MRRYLGKSVIDFAVEEIINGGNPTISFADTYKLRDGLKERGLFEEYSAISNGIDGDIFKSATKAARKMTYIVDHGDFKTQNTWLPGQHAPQMDEF